MHNQEEKSSKEILRLEKLNADEAKQLVREQARTKAYLAREQEIEKAQKLKDAKRAEDRAREEVQESAKEKLRKQTYEAREKSIMADQEAKRLKNKNSNLD
jgi:hypothetical protein